VSTWCDQLVNNLSEIDWVVQPIVAGGLREEAAFQLPSNARLEKVIDLWGTDWPSARIGGRGHRRPDLPARLALALLGWNADPNALTSELTWCHLHPDDVIPSFRGRRAWRLFIEALHEVASEPAEDVTPGLELDTAAAVRCYHAMSWAARAAAFPIPATDVVHVTAAGWASIPGLVQKRLRGTPLLLTEHGVYVREAYLASARSLESGCARFISTRIARGLARAVYHAADLITPVTEAHRSWEVALGAPPERIWTIPNGVLLPDKLKPAPKGKIVVSVGRIDPLKDVLTMLRVASEVLRRHPDAVFLHYGPVAPGQEAYFAHCERLHRWLYLQESFRFMGPTSDPNGVIQGANVALMTSISEGFPMAVLEALSQGRPVVTTLVGGVLDAVLGAGLTAAPRDVAGLADATCALLDDPELAATLGARGHDRVRRRFTQDAMLAGYREVFADLAGAPSQAVSA
jgi:glycosyltransferase involved in cell wall biosynthesis